MPTPSHRIEAPSLQSQRGFTLIELIMVMVVVGILAVFVAPSFFDAGIFRSRGFADQVAASLRYAQKTAIAQRRVVCVAFDTVTVPNSITLTIDSDTPADGVCNPAPAGDLPSPTGEASYKIEAPASTTFAAAPADFSFDAQGSPSFAAAASVSVSGVAGAITVEAVTGYVY